MVRLTRHTTYIRNGVSKKYEGAKSNVPPTQEAIAAGASLYAENCAACHGGNGMGNGDMGKALSPSPALLAYMIRRPIAVDEYLLWSVSEGGSSLILKCRPSRTSSHARRSGRSSLTRDQPAAKKAR